MCAGGPELGLAAGRLGLGLTCFPVCLRACCTGMGPMYSSKRLGLCSAALALFVAQLGALLHVWLCKRQAWAVPSHFRVWGSMGAEV